MRHPEKCYLFVCQWCGQQQYSKQGDRDTAEADARVDGWGMLRGHWHCGPCLAALRLAEKRKPRRRRSKKPLESIIAAIEWDAPSPPPPPVPTPVSA